MAGTPRNTLVVFAKAPRLGQVKSRLARDIGRVDACRFYRRCLAETVRRLGSDPRWDLVLAVTPDPWAHRPEVWPTGGGVPFPLVGQDGGDLGTRMQRAMDRIGRDGPRGRVRGRARGSGRGPLVIIGTDIPEIPVSEIARAFRSLGAHDAVFGPSDDGGYWLVGLRRAPRVPRAFGNVRWSTEYALADTLKNLTGSKVAMLQKLEDVDDGPSYLRWRKKTGR